MNASGLELTWSDLVVAEPNLARLEAEVRSVRPSGRHFCANAVWYGYGGWPGFKARYVQLVGWDRGEPTDDAAIDQLGCVDLAALMDEIDERRPALQQRMAADKEAGRGFLWSEKAYDVGYHHLYELLPDCSECGCIRLSP